MIPLVSILLTYTSICGAALFAADLEDERTGKKSEEINVGTMDELEKPSVDGNGSDVNEVKKKKEL
jgi:hypothetical protein